MTCLIPTETGIPTSPPPTTCSTLKGTSPEAAAIPVNTPVIVMVMTGVRCPASTLGPVSVFVPIFVTYWDTRELATICWDSSVGLLEVAARTNPRYGGEGRPGLDLNSA